MICAWCVLGCGTTPIEAVVIDHGASNNAEETPTSSGEVCAKAAAPAAGRFVLSVEAACLRRGAATSVFGNAAFFTELSADCTSDRAQWDLTPAVAGTFTLRNVEDQLSLDVRAASDVPGTPIIVYDPNTLDNQRFWFRPRKDTRFELAPRHAPGLCAEARASGVEIWPCQADDAAQAFRFARVSCQ